MSEHEARNADWAGKDWAGEDGHGFELHRMAEDERLVRRGFWRKLRRTAGRIPFAREAVAAWCCATDPKTPVRVKAILLGALAYFVLPTDVIPDFVVALGYTDDIAVFWAAWQAVSGHVTAEHRIKADELLERDQVAAE